MHLKMSSAACTNAYANDNFDIQTNSVGPDSTALREAVGSGFTLFAAGTV